MFKDEEDFSRYLGILEQYRKKYKFKLYHYVLMRNHVHLVLQPSERGGGLSEIMKGVNLSYAYHYKKKYKHVGTTRYSYLWCIKQNLFNTWRIERDSTSWTR